MLDLASLSNWNVRLEDMITPSHLTSDKNYQYVLRTNPTDNSQTDILGVVGERYHVMQNEDLFSFGDNILDGAVGTGVLNELAPHGMKGLAYWENGWRAFTNNKRPVNKPEDLKGLKIRSTPNPYHIQAFKLLGMNPSPMPIAELYTALETGTFDAQEHPINVTWSSKFYEVQKHLTVSNHVYSPLVVAMNKGKFDSLPANYQTIVVEAAREAAKYQRGLNAANAGKVVADLKKSGMQVIENVDMAPFQKIVSAEIAKTFGEKNGPALLQAIENTK